MKSLVLLAIFTIVFGISASAQLKVGGYVISGENSTITPNNSRNVPSIIGTKTVGSGGDYANLTAAVAALNGADITGPVTLVLTDANYSSGETFPLVINPNNGSSSTNTITIKPAVGVSPSISGSSASCILNLSGADWVIVDGSNTVGGTSRDLTITNTNTGTSSAVVCLQNTATPNGATNNTIKNLNVVGNGNTQTLFGIFSGSSTISTFSTGNGNNNNTIQNNNVSKTQYGIFSQGLSAASKNSGNVITRNSINTPSPNNVRRAGVFVGFENNIQITQNNIGNIASATAVEDVFGISLGSNAISTSTFTGNEVTNANISKNLISGVRQTVTYCAIGIYVAAATSGTNQISNNMISGVSANGTSGDYTSGITVGGGVGSTTQIYYNSIALTGTQTGGSDKSFGIAVGGNDPIVDIRNNIFYNTLNNGTGNNYAIGLNYSTFANLTSNNNDFFTATGATYFIGGTGSIPAPTNQLTLANWQATTLKDANSVSGNPNFIDPVNDLHQNPLNIYSSVTYDKGTPVSVTDDFDGQIRSTIGRPGDPTRNAGGVPDIGADELLAPVAAGATVTGKLVTPSGRGLANSQVMLTDSTTGEVRYARSGSFGMFTFTDLPSGHFYIIDVPSKRYRFNQTSFTLNGDLDDLVLTAQP